jgi:uncharacterized membrane protein YkvA (DUF1232 family)
MPILSRLIERAKQLKTEVYALYLAVLDPRTPWYARVVAGLVAAYAFSPIDLIPDFIPVLGYLDDLILIPLGVALSLRLIPKEVMAESRAKARERQDEPVSRWGAVIVAVLWLAAIGLVIWWMVGWRE